ncbi:MAG: lysylphosphatidylglycerol synthase transmembrane domain-containing protein [Candidatus Omnitrophota bacterium]
MEYFKKVLSLFLRVSISLLLLYFLFRQVEIDALAEIIRGADKPLLFLAFLVFFFCHAFCLFRWEMLLRALKIRLPLKRVIISFSGGAFFSLFLPSTIGGDLMRSVDLAAHTKKPKEIIATVLLDRLSGFVGLVVLCLLSLAFGWELLKDRSVFLSLGLITAVLSAILIVLFNKSVYGIVNRLLHSPDSGKIRQLIKSLHDEIHIFRHHKRVIINNLLLSVVIQAISPLTVYIIALSLGIKVSIVYFFIFVPIIGAITLLPISIGGLGLRDATMIFFFAKAGLGKDISFAISLLNFFIILMWGVIGGFIYVLTIRHRRIQHHKAP